MLHLFLVMGGTALTLQPVRLPAPITTLAAPQPVYAPARSSPIRCAYDPKPSKAKKVKSKAPKQKVKGPTSTAAQLQLVPEQTFFEGAPSITETLIPGLSVFTVVGVIPFTASLARQAWTRYKITNKRLEVSSGFQGKDIVQVTWREVTDAKWLRRYGGACGDLVLSLRDGAKIEIRSLPEFDRNLKFIMDQLPPGTPEDSGYPDAPAREFLAKVEAGTEPPVVLPPTDTETAAASDESSSAASA